MPEFMSCYGTEQQCADALFAARWPAGFRCPRCAHAGCWRVRQDRQTLMQCCACRHQCSLTAGTVMDWIGAELAAIVTADHRFQRPAVKLNFARPSQ